MSYCKFSQGHPLHGPYHDREYGFPIRGDAALLERLALEINQAGLSWLTMLQKRDGFRKAYAGFEPERVARFGAKQYARLMKDAGIIRNRLKIRAVAENARRLLAIRESHGSFAKWLDAHHPLSQPEWERLFKKTFVFTGGKIVQAFLMSTGYLKGAHDRSCPVYARVLKKNPAWAKSRRWQGAAARSRTSNLEASS
jgi:DNA-3-methyladenine glycosylase I